MKSFRTIRGAVLLLTGAAAALSAGCRATVGASGVSVPRDSGAQCARHCQSIGMELTAVAIMANNVGCVCQHRGTTARDSSLQGQVSTTAGGMTAILAQQAAQQQQQQRQVQGY